MDGLKATPVSPDLRRRFEGIEVDEELAAQMKNVRDHGLLMAVAIDAALPDSREKSLALTKIEEAVFWANRGIAVHG